MNTMFCSDVADVTVLTSEEFCPGTSVDCIS